MPVPVEALQAEECIAAIAERLDDFRLQSQSRIDPPDCLDRIPPFEIDNPQQMKSVEMVRPRFKNLVVDALQQRGTQSVRRCSSVSGILS